MCVPELDRYHSKDFCTPHSDKPIYPLTASERDVTDLTELSTSNVHLAYDTRLKVPAGGTGSVFSATPAPSFGALWQDSLHKKLVVQSGNNVQAAVQASRGQNVWVSFQLANGNYIADIDINDRLASISGGWRYTDATAQAEEIYDSTGTLKQIVPAQGSSLSFNYNSSPTATAPAAGLLTSVVDAYGRTLGFSYEQPTIVGAPPRVSAITTADGRTLKFDYDGANNLAHITWPDAAVKGFVYERSDLPWAMTGIVDENGARMATIVYDASGRATESVSAGNVDHYIATWTTPPAWNIVDTYDPAANVIWRDHYWALPQGTIFTLPNGQNSALSAVSVLGASHPSGVSQPAGSGCEASSSDSIYDANGNTTQVDDFNGHRACSAYDSSNRETARVEGLANTAACSGVIGSGATLPTASRKTSTTWHPDWRLPVQVAEPGRITTYAYNGQSGASCAPASALLPDGKPIPVLCKKSEQATTDNDGHLALSATVQSGVSPNTWSYTYNANGQVLTATDPFGNTTTSTYYADTSFTGTDPNAIGHTIGDLQSVKDSVGNVTQYTQYDKAGRLLASIDANGIAASLTYWPRGWLKSSTVGGRVTNFAYWPTGLLQQATLPDGSFVSYHYDDAHRLTDVTDNLGNDIHYALDNAGNSTEDDVKDPSGTLQTELGRVMDALNRTQQTTGKE